MRHHNTELIKTVIENNKNMKVLNKTFNTRWRLKIHQLKDTNGNITEEKRVQIYITENFYKTLYQETIPK